MNDTRTEAVKLQHTLFQLLGTLERTKRNLENLARPAVFIAFKSYELPNARKYVLLAAVHVLNDIIDDVHVNMQRLPNKKRMKLSEQEKQ